MKRFLSLALLLAVFAVSSHAMEDPFHGAIGLWHFADTANSADPQCPLQIEGNVVLGCSLSETDSAESRLRGGDGYVADFSEGGYLNAGLGSDNRYDIKGSSFTWYLRLRDPSGIWNAPILSHIADDGRPVYRIYSSDSFIRGECTTIRNRWSPYTDAPFNDMRGESARLEWHDLILRSDGVKEQLYIDGRLYDEDFLLEDLISGVRPLLFGAEFNENQQIKEGFRGQIDTAALWDRPLSKEEILMLAGGPCKADPRQLTDRGDDASLQYWIPPNHHNVGDCMPFYAEGVFHFMYLIDKNHHGSRNGLGAHQWIQATSRDLVHWKHQPFLFELEKPEEGSFCTGSVFYHDGVYYAFYANRAYEYPNNDHTAPWQMIGQIAMATSNDGIRFQKTGVEPLINLPSDYARTNRDPVVFRNPVTKKFHMYFTTSHRVVGCWAQAVSDDLYHWELADPIYAHQEGEPECPDWFRWGDKYYTIENHTNGYWLWSDSPTGPWDIPPVSNTLMPGITTVPKTAPFGDDRRLICGWTRESGWGGHAVFHELIRHDNGTLGEKFVPEMIPPTDKPVIQEQNFSVKKLTWKLPHADIQVRMQISYPPEKRDQIRDLYFQFVDETVLNVSAHNRSISMGDYKLNRLDFTSGELDLRLILKDGIADLEVNGEKTLTAFFPQVDERELFLQTDQEENWFIKFFEVSPIKEQE